MPVLRSGRLALPVVAVGSGETCCSPTGLEAVRGVLMVRRWCLPVAAFALVGGVVAGAGQSASAAPVAGHQAVQPGGVARQVGPVFGSHGLKYGTSTNWSGYASEGGPGQDTDVSAAWTEPTGHCS